MSALRLVIPKIAGPEVIMSSISQASITGAIMPTDVRSNKAEQMKFAGRILFLTEDTSLIRRQLEAAGDEANSLEEQLAQRLMNDDLPLMNNISTDEITPGWVCFHYDETLGQNV